MALLLLPPADALAPRRRKASASADTRPPSAPARAAVKSERAVARVVKVSDPVREAWLSPLLSGPVIRDSYPPPPLKQQLRDGDEDKREYYVNLGYAIRTLREEFPEIFFREPSFDIYRDDIVFKDPLNTFFGIGNYKRIFRALRFSGWLFFKALWVDVVSVWQPVENIIMIRWTVYGIPRVPWESRGRFDGTSEYKLDKNGKIYEHKVDNVALNSHPRFRVLAVEELFQSLGCPSTPKPTYFEIALSRVIPYTPFLLRFTWVRSYIAFHLLLGGLLYNYDNSFGFVRWLENFDPKCNNSS